MNPQEYFPYPRPPLRPLKIYAFDPMMGLDRRTRVSVETRNEPLQPGPMAARIAVVDYDVSHDCYYMPVDLDDQAILMQGGIDHSEGDPRFHQQMVYAVASRVIEVFDRALGRPLDLAKTTRDGKRQPLRFFPHFLQQANAFFNADLNAVLFGYFEAEHSAVGANIPGQMIYVCLSHDIIAHELTHALIYRLVPTLENPEWDPSLLDPHPDIYALSEGICDLVSILHRFSLESVVRDELQRTRGLLDVSSTFCQLGQQVGAGVGMVHGLRSANLPANPSDYATMMEPHDRGALIVSAAIEALFKVYRAQVRDLFDLSGMANTGGELHPDLINRLAGEISRVATSLLTMCIRAFDYMPPVDVTFGDFLRAVVTADWELEPADHSGLRAALIESFRARGIYATGARSLAEESLRWERPGTPPAPLPKSVVTNMTQLAGGFGRIRPEDKEEFYPNQLSAATIKRLKQYARQNARALHLWPDKPVIDPIGGYSFRVSSDRKLAVDIVVKFFQVQGRGAKWKTCGVTVVASADGAVRYVINNQPQPKFEAAPKVFGHPTNAFSSHNKKGGGEERKNLFPSFQLSRAQHRKSFPALSLTNEEIEEITRQFGPTPAWLTKPGKRKKRRS